MIRILKTGLLLALLGVLHAEAAPSELMTLDELAGDWKQASVLEEFPSIHTPIAQLLVNKDFASVSFLASPPYAQGFHSGALKVDGELPVAEKFRWFAYQVEREGTTNGLAIKTVNRMVFDERGLLWRISVSNTQSEVREATLSIGLIGNISKLTFRGAWDWVHKRPGRGKFDHHWQETIALRKVLADRPPYASHCTAEVARANSLFVVRDTTTPAQTAFAFVQKPDELTRDGQFGTATWALELNPGETKIIEYVMAFGEGDQPAADAVRWSGDFNATFDATKTKWDKRFAEMFTPGNTHFSGSLPVFETDDLALRRNYYMGALTMLLMTKEGLPALPRVLSGGGPIWGSTVQFIWDTGMVDTLYALLDPQVMKAYIKQTLSWNMHKYLAYDNYGRRPQGAYTYVANFPVMFRVVSSYLRVTGDRAILEEKLGNRTILSHIDAMARNYMRYIRKDSGLADFGGHRSHFLECVKGYTHAPAGFNAAYVGIMREVADLHESLGDKETADKRRADADKLAAAVLPLYVDGKGFWQVEHPGGKRFDVRHCLDFQFIGQSMASDLAPHVRREMRDFAVNDLITDHWMRAQSLKDPNQSHRADHGSRGAYSGWPPETAAALCQLGFWKDAIEFYRNCEAASHEEAFAQGHVHYGPNAKSKSAPVRIAGHGICRVSLCGADFADVMIRTFFGFHPNFNGELKLLAPNQPRGFSGQLKHVRWNGGLYTITSDASGIHIEAEK